MKFWYKKARKYMHLYAESQREYKKLNERYMASLKSLEECLDDKAKILQQVYDLTLENAQLKLQLKKRDDAISFIKPKQSGIMMIDEL